MVSNLRLVHFLVDSQNYGCTIENILEFRSKRKILPLLRVAGPNFGKRTNMIFRRKKPARTQSEHCASSVSSPPALHQSPTLILRISNPVSLHGASASDGRGDHGLRCVRGPPIGVLRALDGPFQHPSAFRPPIPRSCPVPQALYLLV